MGSNLQRRPSKIPPVVPDFSSVATFYTSDIATLPCNVMSKLQSPIQLFTEAGRLQDVPANSRLLRYFATPQLVNGGESEAQVCDSARGRKVIKDLPFQISGIWSSVALGFIRGKGCEFSTSFPEGSWSTT